MKKQYEVEFEEAPCGYVKFYNYKEPLMKYEGGHGFVGALVYDGKSGKVQCHLCGEWFEALGNHLHREHAMNAEQYKVAVGLNKSSALIGETVRAKLIAHGLTHKGNRKNLRPGRTHSQETREKIRQTMKENRDELKNLHGTCPEQLIENLVKLYQKLGRMPLRDEIKQEEALIRTYGSIKEACQIAGLPYRSPGQTISGNGMKTNWPEVKCIELIRDFFDKNGRLPVSKELPKQAVNRMTTHYGRKNVERKALAMDGRYRRATKIFRYSKEELLEFIRRFEAIHKRRPSYSDCKRGLLPNLSRYSYNFGSWQNALRLAFPV